MKGLHIATIALGGVCMLTGAATLTVGLLSFLKGNK